MLPAYVLEMLKHPQNDHIVVSDTKVDASLTVRERSEPWPNPFARHAAKSSLGDPEDLGVEVGDEGSGGACIVRCDMQMDAA